MKRFVNRREAAVTEAIDGFLAVHGDSKLGRLDDFPDIKVVLRTDWDRSRVALISGGGSGHEPAHVGFVGEGMLTAAVCGEIFASPSVEAVLAAILAVAGEPGVLLIVKNYTGDRLNFGLAAEQAQARGVKVEIVIVGDDIALPDNPQPRGIAGTIFVHKLAGAAAAAGRSLDEVAAVARDAATHTLSLGLALTSCTPFTGQHEERIAADQAELGLGIHGEPGAELVPMADAQVLFNEVASRLRQAMGKEEARYALMINNLGAVPPLDMAILAHGVLQSELAPVVDHVLGPAPFMTSLDMKGFSLSLLRLDAARLEGLRAPTAAPAWQGVRRLQQPSLVQAAVIDTETFAPSADARLKDCLQRIVALMGEIEGEMNALDGKVGDGDTGTTFALAARAIEARLDGLPLAEPDLLMRALAQILERSAGGSSGVLLAILFAAAAAAYAAEPRWGKALRAGLEKMKAYGGAGRGDRTMIDALEPAFDVLAAGGSLAAAAKAAREGADGTAAMEKARAGRSSYIGGRELVGHVDPGAEIVARIFAGLAAHG